MTFSWNGMHGLFQIPTIACPSNFTAPKADGYEYLAPPSNGGSFSWSVPNKTGQYWLTSQWPGDCQNGTLFFVVHSGPLFIFACPRGRVEWSGRKRISTLRPYIIYSRSLFFSFSFEHRYDCRGVCHRSYFIQSSQIGSRHVVSCSCIDDGAVDIGVEV